MQERAWGSQSRKQCQSPCRSWCRRCPCRKWATPRRCCLPCRRRSSRTTSPRWDWPRPGSCPRCRWPSPPTVRSPWRSMDTRRQTRPAAGSCRHCPAPRRTSRRGCTEHRTLEILVKCCKVCGVWITQLYQFCYLRAVFIWINKWNNRKTLFWAKLFEMLVSK